MSPGIEECSFSAAASFQVFPSKIPLLPFPPDREFQGRVGLCRSSSGCGVCSGGRHIDLERVLRTEDGGMPDCCTVGTTALLKNASTYYRGAAAHARLDAECWGEGLKEAIIVKEAVVEEMRKGNGFNGRLEKGAEGFSKKEGEKVLVDMIEDGLIVLGGH